MWDYILPMRSHYGSFFIATEIHTTYECDGVDYPMEPLLARTLVWTGAGDALGWQEILLVSNECYKLSAGWGADESELN